MLAGVRGSAAAWFAMTLAACGRVGFGSEPDGDTSADDVVTDVDAAAVDGGPADASRLLAPAILCNTSAAVSPDLPALCTPPFAQTLYASDDGTQMFVDAARTAPLTGARWMRCVAAADGISLEPATGAVTDTPAGCPTALHLGMTWALEGAYTDDLGVPVVSVAVDAASNPYTGDTAAATALPLMCLRKVGLPAPTPNTFYDPFYREWSGGYLVATAPVFGSMLTSAAVGDAVCAQLAGEGFEFAEFHDAGGGWGILGEGPLAGGTRYWVWISDQPANPWN
jgi:hypothetical protein